MPNIGKLDRRVILETSAVTRGEIGGQVETWSQVATLYARVQDANGSQIFQSQAQGNRVDKVVTIRYRAGVLAAMRLLLPTSTPPDMQIARINWVKEVGRKDFLELYCEVING